MKQSISFLQGFLGPMRNDGVLHVYSSSKARKMVLRAVSKDKTISKIYVGLDGDWKCNNDLLWDGKFHKPYFYTQSIWAKPSLLFVYKDGKEKDGGYCYDDKPLDKK